MFFDAVIPRFSCFAFETVGTRELASGAHAHLGRRQGLAWLLCMFLELLLFFEMIAREVVRLEPVAVLLPCA